VQGAKRGGQLLLNAEQSAARQGTGQPAGVNKGQDQAGKASSKRQYQQRWRQKHFTASVHQGVEKPMYAMLLPHRGRTRCVAATTQSPRVLTPHLLPTKGWWCPPRSPVAAANCHPRRGPQAWTLTSWWSSAACLSLVGLPAPCLPARLSSCLPACLPSCLPACLSSCLPACLSIEWLVPVPPLILYRRSLAIQPHTRLKEGTGLNVGPKASPTASRAAEGTEGGGSKGAVGRVRGLVFNQGAETGVVECTEGRRAREVRDRWPMDV